MANYFVTTFTTTGTLAAVAASLETSVETIVDTKTIRVYQIDHLGGDQYAGVLVVTT